jgi:hypothetical protein
MIGRQHRDHVGIACLDGTGGVLEHVDPARPAQRVLHAPARRQPQPPRGIDGVVRPQGERGDRQPVHRAMRHPGMAQHLLQHRRQQILRRHAVAPAGIGQFHRADDGHAVEVHRARPARR